MMPSSSQIIKSSRVAYHQPQVAYAPVLLSSHIWGRDCQHRVRETQKLESGGVVVVVVVVVTSI
jgi:hypothetical protein